MQLNRLMRCAGPLQKRPLESLKETFLIKPASCWGFQEGSVQGMLDALLKNCVWGSGLHSVSVVVLGIIR